MSKEKILEQKLWGVHLPLLDSHYKFKEKILDAMQEYADQEIKRAIREHILIEMIKDDEESGSYDVNTESDEK